MNASSSSHATGFITDTDEIKVFECEQHEDDRHDRLSPVIKDDDVRHSNMFINRS
jgi:hypothetical protein